MLVFRILSMFFFLFTIMSRALGKWIGFNPGYQDDFMNNYLSRCSCSCQPSPQRWHQYRGGLHFQHHGRLWLWEKSGPCLQVFCSCFLLLLLYNTITSRNGDTFYQIPIFWTWLAVILALFLICVCCSCCNNNWLDIFCRYNPASPRPCLVQKRHALALF